MQTQQRTGWTEHNVRDSVPQTDPRIADVVARFLTQRGTVHVDLTRRVRGLLRQYLGPHVPHGGVGHVHLRRDARRAKVCLVLHPLAHPSR